MRWLATYKNDDVRVIKRFLLIPCRLANEWRWLETAYIKETYYMGSWLEKQWVSHDEYIAYVVILKIDNLKCVDHVLMRREN